jgi:hypothetical protein
MASAKADPPWSTKKIEDAAAPVATGGTGVVIQVGQIFQEESNSDLRGPKWYGNVSTPGIADEMVRTDAQVRQSLQTMIDPITNAVWDAEAASKDAAHAEHAKLISYNFFKWRLPMDRFLRQSTSGALKHGVSLFEMTTDVVEVPASEFPLHPSPEVNGKKRVLFVTGFEQRLPRTIWKWNADSKNSSRLESLEQWVQGDDTTQPGAKSLRTLPTVRANGSPGLLRFTFDEDGNNFEGLAKIRSVWFSWKTKRILRLLDGVRHERQNLGVPTIVLPPNANAEDKKYAKKILDALRGHERAYIVLPNGYTFEFNTSGAGNGTNIAAAIEMCDRDIWMNVGAPFMVSAGAGDTGSYAMADVVNDIRILGLMGLAKLIQEPLNVGVDGPGVIPWIITANYGDSVLQFPRIGPTNMPTQPWTKVMPEITKAVLAGSIIADDSLEAWQRRIMGAPPADPSTARTPVKQTPGEQLPGDVQTSAPAPKPAPSKGAAA